MVPESEESAATSPVGGMTPENLEAFMGAIQKYIPGVLPAVSVPADRVRGLGLFGKDIYAAFLGEDGTLKSFKFSPVFDPETDRVTSWVNLQLKGASELPGVASKVMESPLGEPRVPP